MVMPGSEIELGYQVSGWGSDNFVTALMDIAEVGYRGIEIGAGLVELYEDRVPVFLEILDEHAIELVAVISGGRPINEETREYEIERALNIARFLKAVGSGLLVLYPPIQHPGVTYSREDFNLFVKTYEKIAEGCIELGITISIHPETGTFLSKEKEIDAFLDNTNPELVFLTPDVGFLSYASISGPRFLDKFKDRTNYVHFKDIKKPRKKKNKTEKRVKPLPKFCELGRGRINLKKCAQTLIDNGYSGWITVELERPKAPKRSCKTSYNYARDELDIVLD